MAGDKHQAYMSKSEQKRLLGNQKRADKARADQEAREREIQERAAKPEANAPIVIKSKAGRGGGHNCPNKNAGKTHAFSQRCIAKGHAGACRLCHNISSGKDGCSDCEQKPKDLQYTNIHFSLG